ncbi:hypothetical protein J6590_099204 [Homalodisca vitripennis]|nr:hypothetical protein J6590_099204 [Homalodisca vitripennis]
MQLNRIDPEIGTYPSLRDGHRSAGHRYLPDEARVHPREADICRSHWIGAKSKPQPHSTVKHRPNIVRLISYRDRRMSSARRRRYGGLEL